MVAHAYGGQSVPNLGIFAIRSGRRTKALLDRIWTMTEYVDHKWWENAALLDLLGYDIETEPIRKVKSSPLDRRIEWLGNEWNSISLDAAAQPIIVHYPGHTNEDRKRLMRADVDACRKRQTGVPPGSPSSPLDPPPLMTHRVHSPCVNGFGQQSGPVPDIE